MNAACVVAVLDTGINTDNITGGNYLPEISFNPETDIPVTLKAHGTDVCNTILKIAPEAILLPVQITNEFGQLNTPLLEAALDWILQKHQQMNIKVVCAAFADYTHHLTDKDFADSKVRHQIILLKEQGVIVVAAAGNHQLSFNDKAIQGMAWPAIIREVVSVGALNREGQIATYSQRLNKGMKTDCATTVFTMPDAPGDTSGATAVMAGVIAKLYTQHPGLTTTQLTAQLKSDMQIAKDEEENLWPVFFYRP
ncbi:S8/S53 family peptidase [Taibaiella lutea]|uniref:S8/S53 family peptidase n=1 Tax=Taibaiella lutea TaxID=2608001 RepID=A0A5M6CHQ8_9BACT|nr:S8/S53 family peptidase [Taibaiella lutea]KAA5534533.1 S8/S53 family peptidase [Taibaiella lutea]